VLQLPSYNLNAVALFKDGNGNFEFTMVKYPYIMAKEATNPKPSMQTE